MQQLNGNGRNVTKEILPDGSSPEIVSLVFLAFRHMGITSGKLTA